MKRLHWYDTITINLFWFGLNIRNTALGSIFMPYLVALFVPEAIKNTALGAMRSAGLVIAMLVQPAAGMLSDRSTSALWTASALHPDGGAVRLSLPGCNCTLLELLGFADLDPADPVLLQRLARPAAGLDSRPGAGRPAQPRLGGQSHHGAAADRAGRADHRQAGRRRSALDLAIFVTGAALLVVTLITMITVKETPLTEKPTTPFWPPMLRVLGMLGGILAGGLAGVLGGAIGRWVWPGLITWLLAGKSPALAVGIGVGGAAAMIVAVVAGVWAGCLGTLGRDARQQSSFVWWIANRLMFLAAATSLQGSIFYFVMYAFKLTKC